MSDLIVGSIALDTVKTPVEEHTDLLGGSASYAALASNLVSWLQLTALPEGHQARAWDVKRWRYRLFATAGKIFTKSAPNE